MSDSHGFGKDVWLDGKSLYEAYLTHEELMQGGTVKFIFSDEEQAQ